MRPMGLKPSGEAPPAGDKPASQMRQASLDPTVGVQPGGQPSGEALASQQPSQEKKAGFSDPNEIPDLDDQ